MNANENLKVISPEVAERRDLKPMHKVVSGSSLEFHVTVGGPGSVPVMIRVDAWCQLRAEQFAMAWARCRWYRDARKLQIVQTEWVN